MNAEGISGIFTPEWLQAIATGLLVLLVAAWIPAALGTLWRRTVWREAGGALSRVAERLGAPIEPIRAGWRVASGAVVVEITGGLAGVRTRVRSGERSERVDGVPPTEALLAMIQPD